jgi:hypothetical protein
MNPKRLFEGNYVRLRVRILVANALIYAASLSVYSRWTQDSTNQI